MSVRRRGDSLDSPTLRAVPLFDGPARRDRGIARVSSGREDWLFRARKVAEDIARERGSVTADDLREFIPEPSHPNLYGAVFSGNGWVVVAYEQSKRPEAHARLLRRWRLK